MARPQKEKSNKRGRNGKFAEWITPDGLTAIEGWAREGATDCDIARKIGICVQTLCEWKKLHPEIAEALKKGKAPVDFEVENTLLKSALGFTVTVKEPIKLKKKTIKNGVGTIEEERIEYAEREIYVKPETTAQIFWLKNRRPDKWRDKHEVAQTADGILADLIDGLKEPVTDDLHTEAAGADGAVADE